MSRPLLIFGPFQLAIATRELSRDGQRVAVPPRSFDCIAYLASHRDRAVGRDELVAAVWGKTSVSDTVLGKTILAARRALEDSVEAPRYIRTVSRFGYHWIAPVQAREAALPDAPPALEAPAGLPAAQADMPAKSAPTTRRLPVALLLLALVLAAIAAAVLWQQRPAPTTATPATATPPATGWTAAVLPVTVSGNADDAWLRLGLMDLIAVRLRGAGIATLPSDALLRLVRADTPAGAALASLREAGQVQQLLQPAARRNAGGWAVRIALRRPEGVTLEVEEQAVDPIHAAHAAVDRLLQRLGHALPAPQAEAPAQLSLEALLQRLEAARLGDDLAGIRALVAQAPAELAARPEVRLRLAQADMRAGHFDAALAELDTLLAATGAESAPVLRAQILYAQGTALILANRFAPARAAYDAGIALLAQQAAPDIAARLYMGRGNLAALQGRFEAAAEDYARARVAFELAGDLFMSYWLDGNEGALQNHLGHPAAALPLLHRAETHFERFNVFNELATTRANTVVAYLALAQPAEALAASARAQAVLPRVADPSLHRLVLLRRAAALAATGRLDAARGLAEGLLAAAESPGESALIGAAHALLARIALQQSQPEVALRQATDALAQLTTPQDLRPRAAAWRSQMQALRQLGRAAAAAAAGQAFAAWAQQSGQAFARQQATLAAAEQAAAQGQADAAHRDFAAALQQATALDLPAVLLETVTAYAGFLIDSGQPAQAIPVAGRIARFAAQDTAATRMQVRLYEALGQAQAAGEARARLRRLDADATTPPE